MFLAILMVIGAVVLGVLALELVAAGVSVVLAGAAAAHDDPEADR
ncbi:MAG TPA: hypothetical protein VN805_08245 [Caulobacteraceae bacterium]|nr:hypothetical protein [Caulobacteraceae bacterium]